MSKTEGGLPEKAKGHQAGWSTTYAIISYLGLGFSAVCSKWLC